MFIPSAWHLLLSPFENRRMAVFLSFVQQSSFKNLRRFVCQSEHSSMKKKRQHMWRKGESDSAEFLTKTKTDVCQKENLRS